MNLEKENICSVKKEDNSGYYRLHTIWKSGGFTLNIASKNGAWRGEMAPNDIKKLSDQLDLNPDVYLNQCKEALTTHDGQPGMFYAVENGCFVWKKMFEEDSGIKIKMGSIILQPTDFNDTIQNIVSIALNHNKNLEKQLKEISVKKEEILGSRNALLNKLDELIRAKEQMEDDLYKSFVLLLNSKKKKIKELERDLSNSKITLKDNKKKNLSLETEKNLYETDTESEDSNIEEMEPCQLGKSNIKKSFSHKTNETDVTNINTLSDEHLKTNKENAMSSHENSEKSKCLSMSSDTISGQNMFQIPKIQSDNNIPLTNDELLDYFFGCNENNE